MPLLREAGMKTHALNILLSLGTPSILGLLGLLSNTVLAKWVSCLTRAFVISASTYMQRIKFLSYPFLYLLFSEKKMFLEYMTKEQQSYGHIVNFY